MKKINTLVLLAALLMGTVSSGQEIKPKFEKEGELIKGTFYYEDGTIRQEGTYKDGKLHGEWISYNQEGQKNAIANYKEGKKDGQWIFWVDDHLTEVNYSNNRIAQVRNYQSTGKMVSRE